MIESKRNKTLGMDLTNRVKDLYTKSYKTLMKEIEEDANKRYPTFMNSRSSYSNVLTTQHTNLM